MAIDISQRITNTWPRTEAELTAETDIDYAQAKLDAIAEAKRKAYGRTTVPSESDIPDVVGEWIADQATIRLVPVAKEHYSLERFQSKSTNRGENVQHYDLMRMLDNLRDELEAECAEKWSLVEDLVGSSAAPSELPEVSTAGLIVDPYDQALLRGLP
jgi:hypothetical protein